MSRIEEAIAKAGQLRQHRMNERKQEAEAAQAAPPEAADQSPRSRRHVIGVGIGLVLAVGFCLMRYGSGFVTTGHSTPVPTVAVAQPRPATPAVQPVAQRAPQSAPYKHRLPGSIPLDARDAAYATAHPGWQRYTSDGLEFRVFSEKSAVKAIQVIPRQGKAISQGFFTSFLNEIADKAPFKSVSAEEKSGYYIEKGTAGSAAEVMVYRKQAAGEIRALVVAYR